LPHMSDRRQRGLTLGQNLTRDPFSCPPREERLGLKGSSSRNARNGIAASVVQFCDFTIGKRAKGREMRKLVFFAVVSALAAVFTGVISASTPGADVKLTHDASEPGY